MGQPFALLCFRTGRETDNTKHTFAHSRPVVDNKGSDFFFVSHDCLDAFTMPFDCSILWIVRGLLVFLGREFVFPRKISLSVSVLTGEQASWVTANQWGFTTKSENGRRVFTIISWRRSTPQADNPVVSLLEGTLVKPTQSMELSLTNQEESLVSDAGRASEFCAPRALQHAVLLIPNGTRKQYGNE